MTLFEKSLRTIELPAVLDMLKAQAISEAAKEETANLRPMTDIYEVREKLAETSAAKKMMEVRGSPSFGGVRDITGAVSRADMGGSLNTIELLDIAAVLRSAANAISYNDGSDTRTYRKGHHSRRYASEDGMLPGRYRTRRQEGVHPVRHPV